LFIISHTTKVRVLYTPLTTLSSFTLSHSFTHTHTHTRAFSSAEMFLHDFRVLTVTHFFLAWCAWWVSVSVLIFVESQEKTFFDTIVGISASRTIVCLMVLLFYIVGLFCYGYALSIHKMSLWKLDRIIAIRLFESYDVSHGMFTTPGSEELAVTEDKNREFAGSSLQGIDGDVKEEGKSLY
jgi:hypothetical protein